MNSLNAFVFAFFVSLTVFGFLGFWHVNNVMQKESSWLEMPLTHHDFFPLNVRTDDFGIASFVLAIIGSFGTALTRKWKK